MNIGSKENGETYIQSGQNQGNKIQNDNNGYRGKKTIKKECYKIVTTKQEKILSPGRLFLQTGTKRMECYI